MPNCRCRMHGGKSTGPKTAEGSSGSLERCLSKAPSTFIEQPETQGPLPAEPEPHAFCVPPLRAPTVAARPAHSRDTTTAQLGN
jgi:hypothetical protein